VLTNKLASEQNFVGLSENDKYQSLLTTLKGCEVFILDLSGIIISSNLEAVTITGYEEWDVIGKPISLFYSSEELQENKPDLDLAKTAKLGRYISSGFRKKKRGDLFWAKMKYFAIMNNGELSGYRVTLSDSTHRAMYTMNTKRIKDEYLSLFNNSFIGIFKFSIKGHAFLMMNEKATQMFGLERESLKVSDIFYSPEEYEAFLKLIESHRHIENFEFRLKSDLETYCAISCKVFSLNGFVEGTVMDITEKKSRINALEKVNAELDNFLYHASHDIRAPLATILGLVNLIKTDDSLENVRGYSERIEGRVKHLDSLLRDLSGVAFNNSQPIASQNIDLVNLINEIVKSFAPEYPNAKVSLNVQPQGEFHSDLTRVALILRNTISNAFKYNNPHGDSHKIEIEFACDNYTALIRINDNGCGIDPTYLKDIFKLFFKMDSRGTGSGLGLYVVQIMLEKLNGKIDVSSALGIGTSVTVTIPNRFAQGPD
jgi:PAS domain S-box-containing protein